MEYKEQAQVGRKSAGTVDYIEVEVPVEVIVYEWRDTTSEVKNAFGVDAQPVEVERVMLKKGQRFALHSFTPVNNFMIYNFWYTPTRSSWIVSNSASLVIDNETYVAEHALTKEYEDKERLAKGIRKYY